MQSEHVSVTQRRSGVVVVVLVVDMRFVYLRIPICGTFVIVLLMRLCVCGVSEYDQAAYACMCVAARRRL